MTRLELRGQTMARGYVAEPCLVICLFLALLTGAQARDAKAADSGNNQALELVRVGNGRLPDGHDFALRVYATTDGTRGTISFSQFTSLQDAQQLIREWLKLAQSVTTREHNKGKGGRIISDRMEATRVEPKSGKKEYLIIRRDNLNCYFIQSLSPRVAKQVEDMIEHPPAKGLSFPKRLSVPTATVVSRWLSWRNISITLIDLDFGEEKAQLKNYRHMVSWFTIAPL